MKLGLYLSLVCLLTTMIMFVILAPVLLAIYVNVWFICLLVLSCFATGFLSVGIYKLFDKFEKENKDVK